MKMRFDTGIVLDDTGVMMAPFFWVSSTNLHGWLKIRVCTYPLVQTFKEKEEEKNI